MFQWNRHCAMSLGPTLGCFWQDRVPLPAAAWQREAELLRRIAEEQAGDPGFTDLFAERAAILLLYAGPDEGAARRWIDTIVGAQRPEGHWQDPTGRSVIVYDQIRCGCSAKLISQAWLNRLDASACRSETQESWKALLMRR